MAAFVALASQEEGAAWSWVYSRRVWGAGEGERWLRVFAKEELVSRGTEAAKRINDEWQEKAAL